VGELAISTASVRAPGEVEVDLEMESLSDGVVVAGTVSVPWQGDCRRCLEPATGTLDASLQEVFKDRPEDADVLAVENEAVDLRPVVHDAVLLALPIAPLCRPDCPGPDPEEFPVTVAPEAAPEPPADPRWAALDELRFDSDAPDSLS
jgi:uncharacterized protein